MATAIRNMSGFPLQYPSEGRLQIRTIARAMMPGRVPSTSGDFCFEFNFNPLFDLSSPGSAFSFFLTGLAAVNSQVGTEIAQRIAMFAFDQVRSRNWSYGLSLSVVLETVYMLEEPRSPDLISNGDSAVRNYYDELDDLSDLLIRPDHGNESEDDTVGMSEREISLLKTEQLINDEDDECCCICLEGFTRGTVITQLSPCTHRFHHGCVVQWLRNNRTCPICRGRCTVEVP